MHFETYEPFSSLIFPFFSGHGKLRITETVDTESEDTGARPYVDLSRKPFSCTVPTNNNITHSGVEMLRTKIWELSTVC
jgi:hypothetical protein